MTLEGWVPQIGEYLTLAEVIDFAFDYRGNTTLVKTDGTEVVGYVFMKQITHRVHEDPARTCPAQRLAQLLRHQA